MKLKQPSSCLPPSIAEALRQAFEKGALLSEPEAAGVIGFSVSTLRREAERGKIAYRLRGARRCYAREDLKEYLTRDATRRPAGEDTTTARPRRRTNHSVARFKSKADGEAFASPEGKRLVKRLRALKKARYAKPLEEDATTE